MPALISWIEIEQADVPARVHAQLLREALKFGATQHLKQTIPKHFELHPETEPGGAYQYAARSKIYNAIKLKKFNHNIPNKATGKLKQHVQQNSVVRGTQSKATLYLKSYFPLPVERRRELEAMTDEDRQFAADEARRWYARESQRPKYRRKRRRRV